jgi:hypothetical protein
MKTAPQRQLNRSLRRPTARGINESFCLGHAQITNLLHPKQMPIRPNILLIDCSHRVKGFPEKPENFVGKVRSPQFEAKQNDL